jgi:hypothetical protein
MTIKRRRAGAAGHPCPLPALVRQLTISTTRRPRSCFPGMWGPPCCRPTRTGCIVEDFSRHIRHAEAFHKRWMGSDRAKRDWCERVSRLEIDMLVPQHGGDLSGRRRAALHQLVCRAGSRRAARIKFGGPRLAGPGDVPDGRVAAAISWASPKPGSEATCTWLSSTFISPASCSAAPALPCAAGGPLQALPCSAPASPVVLPHLVDSCLLLSAHTPWPGWRGFVSVCGWLADGQDCSACWSTSVSVPSPSGRHDRAPSVCWPLPVRWRCIPTLFRWRSPRARSAGWPSPESQAEDQAGNQAVWWLRMRLRPGVSRMRMCFCWTATRPSSWKREKARETVSSLRPR